MSVITQSAEYYAWDHSGMSEQEVIEQIKSGKLDGFENNGEWFVRYETAPPKPSNNTYTVSGRGRIIGARLIKVLAILFVVPLIPLFLYLASQMASCVWSVTSRVIADESRTLGTIHLAGDEIQFEATIKGTHYTSGFECIGAMSYGGCHFEPAYDEISISAKLDMSRVHYYVNEATGHVSKYNGFVIIKGDDKWSLEEDDLNRAMAVYERLTLDWCQARDHMAYRVYDPQASTVEPWRRLVTQGDGVVVVDIVPISGLRSCIDALFWTSSRSSRSLWRLQKDVGSYCPNADLGHADAQYQIGNLYNFSYGNPKRDPIRAYMWYSLALEGGYLEAEEYLKFIASELSPAQLEEAQHLLKQWEPGQCAGDLLGSISGNN